MLTKGKSKHVKNKQKKYESKLSTYLTQYTIA